MKANSYLFKAAMLSTAYWFFDSSIHLFLYAEDGFEFIPSDTNELWMRLMIVLLLISFGIYADKKTKALLKKENEKHVIFEATVKSTNHILNNLLNQMQYFKVKAEESNFLDEADKELYEESIQEGEALVRKLSSVKDLTEGNILAPVYPTPKTK